MLLTPHRTRRGITFAIQAVSVRVLVTEVGAIAIHSARSAYRCDVRGWVVLRQAPRVPVRFGLRCWKSGQDDIGKIVPKSVAS